MEELLNKLIEKGWKPRWWDIEFKFEYIDSSHIRLDNGVYYWGTYKIRELVSKESWLWQFVCENGMAWSWWFSCINEAKWIKPIKYYDNSYEYRIIQSALLDEDKLEDFILENVKIEWI